MEEQKNEAIEQELKIDLDEVNEGEVAVSDIGILNISWSGSSFPTATEGGLIYTASQFYMGS